MARKRAAPMRKKKWVAWLSNHTDRRDDEWFVVWAYSAYEAERLAGEELRNRGWDRRFSLRGVQTVRDFRNFYGRNFPL